MQPVHDSETIRLFVITILRCTCPAEVFDSILEDCSPPSSLPPDTPWRKLVIGHRLLVYLVLLPQPHDTLLISRLLEKGRRERDTHGYNRFRLVLDASNPLANNAADLLDKLPDVDDRIHLHFVTKAHLLKLLPGRRNELSTA